MDKHNDYYTDWDESVYGTGRTEPPKSRGGVIALMLILIIFLCGIVALLGILNIRLFRQLQIQKEEELAISFAMAETMPQETVPLLQETIPPYAPGEVPSMNLQQTPQSLDNVPMEGGISLQA